MSASATTIRDPESAIIRASSPAVARGLTGTATAWARSTPRYVVTNSIRLPIAISTRCPPTIPAAPSPVATRPTSSSSSRPGQAAAAGLDDREAVGALGGRPRRRSSATSRDRRSHGRILPHTAGHSGRVYPAGVTPPTGDRARCNLQQRSTLAGEAAAAAAEVESALNHPRGPDRGGVLRRRQHRDAGREHLPPRPRAAPAQVLHDPRDPRAPPGSRPTSGSSASRTPSTSPRPASSALSFIAGHTVTELEELGEEIFDEAHGAPDLARHPRAGPAAPRRGPAGLAGDRRADRDRPDHRPPARPDRRDGHGRRARRRRLHRPPGRRHAARPGQGRGDQGAGRPRGRSTCAAARRTPTPTTTCRC